MAANKPSWKLRRRAVFGSLIFCGFIIVYVSLRWDDTNLASTLALGAFGLIGAIVASYIGGAAYQDVRLFKQESEATEPEKESDVY
jgi:NhaP-type Na+/H+ or K+/H+ antiporter